jgi:hypothetical protein
MKTQHMSGPEYFWNHSIIDCSVRLEESQYLYLLPKGEWLKTQTGKETIFRELNTEFSSVSKEARKKSMSPLYERHW